MKMNDEALAKVVERMSTSVKVRLVIRRIRPYFHHSPEGALFRCVVEQALLDLASNHVTDDEKDSARRYLTGYIPHAEACGVESSWIHSSMKRVGL